MEEPVMIRHIAASIAVAVPVGLLSSCNPAPVTPAEPVVEVTAPVDEDSLTARGTAVVDHLMAGEYAPVIAQFDATMTTAMPESLLATTMTQLQQQVGAFKHHTTVQETKEAGYDVALVMCVFEKASLNAKVVYNAEGQIAGLFFLPV